ncbi:MAG: Crp/Fnr family transcriptional regulator [Bacteroidota bacterium]
MEGHTSFWYMEEVNLFEHFCPIQNGQEKYDRHGKRSYKKGEFIYVSDDLSDKVFFIHQGAVKIAAYTEDGNENIKAILTAGEVFGELAVFGEERRVDYAQAMENTQICLLARDEVKGLMKEVSGFMGFLNKMMGRRVIFSQKRIESLLFKDARTRIAEYVLEQAEKSRARPNQPLTLRNYLTHQEIASYTGTSRQTVTTIMNQLRESGLIDFNRKTITVNDMGALKAEVARV